MDLCLRPHLEISTCNCFFRIKSKSFIGFWISDLWLEISFTTESTTESSPITHESKICATSISFLETEQS
ncbi:hypothetical protein OIU77_031220 [Salix suchowensis]|uniref:Uncharacterized protein n=1 Tax=Salix suchowensis TaxID=1278906 RepID=A0ABQ9BEQ6_9ROSI|nr:hypothetical protein OIU77_031220 [Salix suchowensis]